MHDAAGTLMQTLTPSRARGVNRVVWNLRHADLPVRGGFGEDDDAPRGSNLSGPYVVPGAYTVRLVVAGKTLEQKVEVRDDPRLDAPPADRKLWSDFQYAGGRPQSASSPLLPTRCRRHRPETRRWRTSSASRASCCRG